MNPPSPRSSSTAKTASPRKVSAPTRTVSPKSTVSGETATSAVEIPEYGGAIADADVVASGVDLESKLLIAGFAVLDKYIVTEADGVDRVRYLKARTAAGDMVMIDPDYDKAYVHHAGHVHNLHATTTATVEHEDRVVSAFNCAKNSVPGVAYESADGICSIFEHKDAATLGATNKTILTTTQGAATVSVGKHGIPYPLVYASEILAAAESETGADQIVQNIHAATVQLRAARRKIHDGLLESLEKDSDKLEDAIERFVEIRKDALEKLEARAGQFEQVRLAFVGMEKEGMLTTTDAEADAENRARYENVIVQCARRYDLLEMLERHASEMIALKDKINKIAGKIAVITEQTEKVLGLKPEKSD